MVNEDENNGKDLKARAAAMFIVAVIAIVLIMPLERPGSHRSSNTLALAALPAAVAWLTIKDGPQSQGLAFLRGGSVALALVGAGALVLLAFPGHIGGLFSETAAAPGFGAWAVAYLGAGLVGVLASIFFA